MEPSALTPSARANNRRVAAILYEVAELLNAKGERFKPQAYAKVAAGLGVFLEINAHPGRLDLSDTGCMIAKQHGAKFAIGSDAHKKEGLRAISPGVATARRGWLAAGDVITTRPLRELRTLLGS